MLCEDIENAFNILDDALEQNELVVCDYTIRLE